MAEFGGYQVEVDKGKQLFETELAFKKEMPKSAYFDKFARPTSGYKCRKLKMSKFFMNDDNSQY